MANRKEEIDIAVHTEHSESKGKTTKYMYYVLWLSPSFPSNSLPLSLQLFPSMLSSVSVKRRIYIHVYTLYLHVQCVICTQSCRFASSHVQLTTPIQYIHVYMYVYMYIYHYFNTIYNTIYIVPLLQHYTYIHCVPLLQHYTYIHCVPLLQHYTHIIYIVPLLQHYTHIIYIVPLLQHYTHIIYIVPLLQHYIHIYVMLRHHPDCPFL